MTEVKRVKARKDYPEFGIVKGEMYYVWVRRFEHYSTGRPPMPTDAQVEAAARAIAVAYEEDPDVPIDGPGHECPLWWVYREPARAALKAAEQAACDAD